MTKIYRYILAHDTGMAPCLTNGVISLATCKPQIRRSAGIGDWVVGFMPGANRRGLVAWAARIGRIVPIAHYRSECPGRADAVYRLGASGVFERRPPASDPGYHDSPEQIRKDLSGPALLFDEIASWYFGAEPKLLPESLMHLAAAGQGHRVNNRQTGDLARLTDWLAECPPGIHGAPRDAPSGGSACERC